MRLIHMETLLTPCTAHTAGITSFDLLWLLVSYGSTQCFKNTVISLSNNFSKNLAIKRIHNNNNNNHHGLNYKRGYKIFVGITEWSKILCNQNVNI